MDHFLSSLMRYADALMMSVFWIYVGCLAIVSAYCLLQVYLWVRYLMKGRHTPAPPAGFPTACVTVQLPLYNEKTVAERLIRNIIRLDWPRDRLQIQILDDSTDGTLDITTALATHLQKEGWDITVHHRTNREGYKAGALRDGLSSAKGDFIAIFDADFLPEPSFLRQTMPWFADAGLALVQARWTHLNQSASLLTEMQALQLNVHFTVEQAGRGHAGYFTQFNGTAGVWRTSAILDAGGWEADTLTEDLDLSFRAQLHGWRCLYREEITAPAELPEDIFALKSQQYRWMKGGAETAKKLWTHIWRSPLSPVIRLHAAVHLLASSLFVFVLALGWLSVLLTLFFHQWSDDLVQHVLFLAGYLIYIMPVWILVYYTANVQRAWPTKNKWVATAKFIALFPVFLSVSMAIALHNSVAVAEGWLGRKTPFIRTPKRGSAGSNVHQQWKRRLAAGFGSPLVLAEWASGALFLGTAYWSLGQTSHPFLLLQVLTGSGYLLLASFHFAGHAE